MCISCSAKAKYIALYNGKTIVCIDKKANHSEEEAISWKKKKYLHA